ncbi:hypothetical protein BU16DRAFT_25218 [Lophium mytilinum]|uniref:Uncharacterized protein n=1 Tax=Lophium mytilinum TaxID=390894 RepID=A0A6A6RHM2_9PEZI|nr:hypothetical protein BU16DRAFT_25218 [Lophium mytilinum]
MSATLSCLSRIPICDSFFLEYRVPDADWLDRNLIIHFDRVRESNSLTRGIPRSRMGAGGPAPWDRLERGRSHAFGVQARTIHQFAPRFEGETRHTFPAHHHIANSICQINSLSSTCMSPRRGSLPRKDSAHLRASQASPRHVLVARRRYIWRNGYYLIGRYLSTLDQAALPTDGTWIPHSALLGRILLGRYCARASCSFDAMFSAPSRGHARSLPRVVAPLPESSSVSLL